MWIPYDFLYTELCHLRREDNLPLLFQSGCIFIYFSHLTTLARTPITMLNRRRRQTSLSCSWSYGEIFWSFPIECNGSYGFFMGAFYQSGWGISLLILVCWGFFLPWNGDGFAECFFSESVEVDVVLSHFIDMVYYID